MQVLWEIGPANVQTVQSRIPGSPKLAYTTVQTMLNVLHRKGKVKRVLRGRAYEYQPVLTQERAEGHAVRDIVDRIFGGSVEGLLMSLMKTRQLDPRKLRKLVRWRMNTNAAKRRNLMETISRLLLNYIV